MAKDQRMEKVVAELRRRIAELEEENRVLKGRARKLKALVPATSRRGGCG